MGETLDDYIALSNNVIDIQNTWMRMLLQCEFKRPTTDDCMYCNKTECRAAWAKLQTIWPEIGDWPSKEGDK